MRIGKNLRIAAALAAAIAVVAAAGLAEAADPPQPGTNTLWSFLGIPQGIQKVRDARLNSSGNRPDRERTPPLKRIADPQNLQSQNPAIKAAAKIKSEEDLAPQKIKAIKYLATIGCGCYPGVREALLDALDDCTEEVRYEAAIAFCQAAGNPCRVCNNSGCCSAAVMTKLETMAHGQDDKGCWKESSARVRAAAENALNACRRRIPASTAPAAAPVEAPPQKKELPLEAPPDLKETPPAPPANSGAGAAFIEQHSGNSATSASAANETTVLANTADPTGVTRIDDNDSVPTTGIAAVAYAGYPAHFGRVSPGTTVIPWECPPPSAEGKAVPGQPAPSEAAPGEPAPAEAPPAEQPAPSANALASAYGATSGPMSAAPNMIGDLFGGSVGQSKIVRQFTFGNLFIDNQNGQFFTRTGSNGTGTIVAGHNGSAPVPPPASSVPNTGTFVVPITSYNDASGKLGLPPLTPVPAGGTLVGGSTTYSATGSVLEGSAASYGPATSAFDVNYLVNIPNPGAGGVVGRTKIAEDESPLPRDRILFDYNFFDGVPLAPGGVSVNRFTPGFEKTFFNRSMSFEMKFPMAVTMDSTVVQDGGTDLSHGEFGNMAMTWKTLLILREKFAMAGGLTVTVPTARDTNVVLSDGTPLVSIRNKSTHLGPFFGFLWTPNDRFFAQAFYQVDVEASPCPVSVNLDGSGLDFVGDLHDGTWQFVDLSIGSWLYRGHDRFRNLTGFAWTLEVHGNDLLKPNGSVAAGNWQIGDFSNTDLWNLTVGAHLEFRDHTVVTLAYVTPLNNGEREFNGELRLMINRYFGTPSRQRVPPNI